MAERLKVLTVVGTRPEIIRLAPTMARLDAYMDHVIVHTGQNYDYELNEVFFEDLGLRRPDHFLGADPTSLGSMLGTVLMGVERVLLAEQPDAVLVLGDTNSAITVLMARRMKIPVYHMEAGNRSFDENVPEEVNRRMVDHVSDYNLVYTEHARRNLLAEGIHPSRILITGSPLKEVLDQNVEAIEASDIHVRTGVEPQRYVLVSAHREENVDNPERLALLLGALRAVAQRYEVPVLVSTHPRTRKRLESQPAESLEGLQFHKPFGFHDYIRLQKDALVVLSDSGTISEESAMLGFPAVSLRDAIERPEALDAGVTITAGVVPDTVLGAVEMVLGDFRQDGPATPPWEYTVTDASRRAVSFIRSTVPTHHRRIGLRRGTLDAG